ncbi:MAG: BlaI/MecI/CopY family transcriptional regulator [Planctomycetes bacterium]|nr:BlaI/MecI/CopY family transcriptional regulator [Planctomycetota bacterium]
METHRNITESEWPIMCALWANGSATAGEIARIVMRERDVSERTVKSLLRRLVEKKAVAYTIDSVNPRLFHYRPLVTRDEAARSKNQTLLSLVYNNRLSDMLAKLVTDNPMSEEEIESLREILDEKAQEQ